MAHCSTCDADYLDTLPECPSCAEDAGPAVRCDRCGERYQGGDACPACGTLHADVPCDTHADRPAEGRCVICARAVCDQCRARSPRAYLCGAHAGVRVIEGWAQVYRATTEFEAQLLRESLVAEGVDAQVFSQRDRIFSVDLGELSIVRLLVPTWEYEHARELLREMRSAEHTGEPCPRCGEPVEPDAARCGGCGAALG